MPKKEDFDLDEEVKRLSRKTNINMKKSGNSYENRLKNLDKEIDDILDKKMKMFDENKELPSKYHKIDSKDDTINRYREKLRKM